MSLTSLKLSLPETFSPQQRHFWVNMSSCVLNKTTLYCKKCLRHPWNCHCQRHFHFSRHLCGSTVNGEKTPSLKLSLPAENGLCQIL